MQSIKFGNPILLKYTTVLKLNTQISISHAKQIFPVRRKNLQGRLKAVNSSQPLLFQKVQYNEKISSVTTLSQIKGMNDGD
jgi:hypothetical protein